MQFQELKRIYSGQEMNINLPFRPEMKKLILAGHKTCTSRTRRYGEIGDTFEIDGRKYKLTGVDHHYLWAVGIILFRDEGFDNLDKFKSYWEKLHPRKGYDPDQLVWIHFFREVLK